MSDRRIESDFPAAAIAALRERFAAKPAVEPKGRSVSDGREEREVKARSYGDRRRKKRGKKSTSAFVQFNTKIKTETRDLIEDLADTLGESMAGAIKLAVEYTNDHLAEILKERGAQDEKAIT